MGPELTLEEQEIKLNFMRHLLPLIAQSTRNTWGMKGGSALRLFHGLPRFSEDMDFQGKESLLFSGELTSALIQGSRSFGLFDVHLDAKQITSTTNRYMLHFFCKEHPNLDCMKIECSFRVKNEWNENLVETYNNSAIMSLSFIAEGKAQAFMSRRKARDVFDMAFLLTEHKDIFQEKTLNDLHEYTEDVGMNPMLSNMRREILENNDWILRNVDCEEVIFKIFSALEESKPLLKM